MLLYELYRSKLFQPIFLKYHIFCLSFILFRLCPVLTRYLQLWPKAFAQIGENGKNWKPNDKQASRNLKRAYSIEPKNTT